MTWLATFIFAFIAFCVAFAVWVRFTPPPPEAPRIQDWWDIGGDR
jgi:hypothetical protein